MLQARLCDYNDGYILVKGTILVINSQITIKKCNI